jgi:hypothetical protein
MDTAAMEAPDKIAEIKEVNRFSNAEGNLYHAGPKKARKIL